MGYYCCGSNSRWAAENPRLAYGASRKLTQGLGHNCHIPYTDEYLAYLDLAVRDAVAHTRIAGFLVDWLWMPNRESTQGAWIEPERRLFEQFMGRPFPGEAQLTPADDLEYSRLALARAWRTIHRAAKETNPACLLWLSCGNIRHPHIVDSVMFREVDWLMNEAGDLEGVEASRRAAGPHTQLVTCLAEWNKVDAKTLVPQAIASGVGLYGFAQAGADGFLKPLSYYLNQSVNSFTGDERNIATLARVYHGRNIE